MNKKPENDGEALEELKKYGYVVDADFCIRPISASAFKEGDDNVYWVEFLIQYLVGEWDYGWSDEPVEKLRVAEIRELTDLGYGFHPIVPSLSAPFMTEHGSKNTYPSPRAMELLLVLMQDGLEVEDDLAARIRRGIAAGAPLQSTKPESVQISTSEFEDFCRNLKSISDRWGNDAHNLTEMLGDKAKSAVEMLEKCEHDIKAALETVEKWRTK